MVEAYNLSNLTQNYDFISTVKIVNEGTDGLIGLLMVISVFLLFLFALKNYETKRAFGVSSFITAVISVLLSAGGMIQIAVPIVFIIMTAGAVLMLILENG